ncbi:hypothetical protein MUK42_17948 [Musa troglodytarum]|uniref:Mediator complex subunit 15 KIX domain-containing protein n=1 Tax=Musa troglodytarum TaxID=320322 RepID=A0A9E7KQI1_9LILI|nr:hypothetical protein MUK42_17948 [Musa troglodytarum]
MEGNSWRPAQGESAAASDSGSADWRTQLQPEARHRIVNKIMESLKRHLTISVPEGLNELQKIAILFEEKMYTAASNQSDYLRRISLKLLSMENNSQHSASINPAMSNSTVLNQNSAHQGNGWSLAEGELSAAANGSLADWRTQLQPEARHKIVNKMHEIWMRRLPFPEPVAVNQLRNIAGQREEAIFNAAHNQSEYLRKISLEMLSVESTSINTAVSNNNQNPTDPDEALIAHGSLDFKILVNSISLEAKAGFSRPLNDLSN